MFKYLKKIIAILLIIISYNICYASASIDSFNTLNYVSVENAQGSLSEQIKNANIGDKIIFGRYEQNNNINDGMEPLEWILLEKDYKHKTAILITTYLIDCQRFNGFNENVTWETCTLREFMNNNMYSLMFNEKEKLSICPSKLSNSPNIFNSSYSGNDTIDNIYIPSIDDMYKYFYNPFVTIENRGLELLEMNSLRSAKGTLYAISKGLRTTSKNNSKMAPANYFLRTTGLRGKRKWYNDVYCSFYQSYVTELGQINPDGTGIHSADDGIRVMTKVYY